MQPEPGTPEDWLRHALSDLEIAGDRSGEHVLLESLCFHAQQAAEKSLKAVLIARGIQFPRTHNLKMLTDQAALVTDVPEAVAEAVILSDYAVTVRYPGPYEEVTEDDHREALRLAEAVYDWARSLIIKGAS